MEQRKAEIEAKRARLAELKRQRENRQKELSASRQSIGGTEDLIQPTPSRAGSRKELDTLISSLVGESRPGSTGPGSPAGRGSRPTSVVSAGQFSSDQHEPSSPPSTHNAAAQSQISPTKPPPNLTFAPLTTVYEITTDPQPERITYSKGVQTSDSWSPARRRESQTGSDGEQSPSRMKSPRSSKRLSRRERESYEEEIRQNLKKEIEEELKALQLSEAESGLQNESSTSKFPARALTDDELVAVNASDEFQDFVEKSTKVIERALDEQYDLLADYSLGGPQAADEDDDEPGATRGKKGRRVREIAQFWDERWSKKRVISDLSFSPKFPELVLASYTKNPSAPHDPDGLIQVWNLHMHDRPEYVFHAQSDILCAKFSPFHPNLIIGGAYSGQVLLWDTRQKGAPAQKTPLTGSGHTHPIYSVDIVGTQNANNIISCSTDGVVCGWGVDMLTKPQESLELTTPPPAKTEDMAPTCMAFPQSDPTYFLAGSEEGTIYPCHRYDRAGAKAGVDTRVAYRGHAAPVMSLDFHPSRGIIDLGDLVLSSSLDWSVKIWKVRPPAAASTTSVIGTGQVVSPLLDFVREDLVYDAKWSPVKPGVFGLVDGGGNLEVWDINVDIEVPLAKASPSDKRGLSFGQRSLNKLAWERNEGKRIAVGGLDGVVTVFEVGADLGGLDNVRKEEWTGVKKLVSRMDSSGTVNGTDGKT
ncbi:cytoplasmic dynein-like protein 1 intermediate chain 2 [Pseudovirgaria hyperparasitica]|uniref:Cytoplasmic dynein-like protein 1 intermediate chain 2 n=1 Tax=Pseudovirgaria hyperparasitica TaxID=470096 RepID=A0A6A6VU89_9PEZI|nr:cytoplasmic dynein-like protein 1 intermediate chain 2 [Pseudovirgaria hyperparasitica]KAF2754142.1 cytoplasmic dynein-like protein 1 intermediate chain 2 [Pseudovirgaria hyperparasitica]